jgi:L,D-transpeptidase ErfK/SrfK
MQRILLIVSLIAMLYSPLLFAKTFSDKLCLDTIKFDCYTIKKNDTWQKLFPNPVDEDAVKRINRMNINLHAGMKIAVPKNLAGADLMAFAPFTKQINPPGTKTIIVSLENLAWGAYDEQGNLVSWGPVSGGKDMCPDTKKACHTQLGKFEVIRKYGENCVSTKFPLGKGGAPMPYCMFFYRGFALHGSPEVPGYNASHGCVRLFKEDAKWLNETFMQDDLRTDVIVAQK